MDYIGQIIRPPSEAYSIILQVTVGCSHNECTFCGAYKEKRFSIKPLEIISRDLAFAATHCRDQQRIFLADGDALIIPFPRLYQLLEEIRRTLPWVRRISLYGSARAIRSKTIEQLEKLKALGLDRVYLGLESGDETVLQKVCKGASIADMIDAARRIHAAGLFLSVTVLLGLAGMAGSGQHARETARVLNQLRPRQVGALTYMPLANTILGQEVDRGTFQLLSPTEILCELRALIEQIEVPTQLHANHASNYLPVTGRLPRDRESLLQQIDQALRGKHHLVPERARRL